MLRGVGWNHTRAMAPLHGLAQVWHDRFGEPTIEWETRSLISFAEEPLDKLSERYDLIIFDYPLSGEALRAGWLCDLTKLLPTSVLRAREVETVGAAYKSFSWSGMQAALPIDAACHVSCWRSDLLERFGAPIPNSWDQAITLANETGKVALPLTRTAVWGILIDFCANLGEPPMKSQSFVFNRDLALDAWARIQKLVKMVPDWCFDSSPVAFLNRMSCGDEIAYCPLTYGYSTYSMRGYAPARISFGDIRLFDGRSPAGAVLGGAGVGISVNCQEPQLAAKHIEWLTSNEVQAGLYAQFGGQPAAASAWTDDETDALSGGFLSATVASMSNCYHRPNVPGFHEFQTRSAYALQSALRVGRSVQGVLDGIDEDWRATFCSS